MLRLAHTCESEAILADYGLALENLVLGCPVQKIGISSRHLAEAFGVLEDQHHTSCLGIGQGVQKHGIHDAEDRGIRADAERKGEDRHQSEGGAFDQHANQITNIAQHTIKTSSAPGYNARVGHTYPAESAKRVNHS